MIDYGINRRHRSRLPALLGTLAIMVVILGCSSGDDLAGTTNIPNARAYGYVTKDQHPVADATVRIRGRLHLSTPGSEPGVVFDVTTDTGGYFEVDGIPRGDYTVEIIDGSGNGALTRHRIEPYTRTAYDLGTLALRLNGSFSGSIVTDNIPDSVSLKVGLYGVERAVEVHGGRFRFENLPPSTYEYFVWSSEAYVGNHSGVTTVSEGEETHNERLFLPIDYRIDSLAVEGFLDAQGVEDFDWTNRTIVRNNRIRGIDLSGLGLSAIDSSFRTLTMIHSVNLARNPLTTFPSVLRENTGIRSLNLDSIPLDTLWPEITTLSRVNYLHINDMGLSSLPDDFDILQNLRFLLADGNAFGAIPPQVCRMPGLERISFSGNKLTTIDSCLFAIPNLEQLHLAGNSISNIPAAVGSAYNLTILNLVSNRVSTIPEAIDNCRSLRELWLYSNRLRTLPAALSRCTSLSKVFVYGNEIDSIPIELKRLPRDVFTLGGNRLCDQPDSIVAWLDDGTDDWRSNQHCD